MKVSRGDALNFIPASHEDPKNPGVLKKVLFSNDEICAGQVRMVNWALLPMGKSFRAHYHQDMDEVFIIVSGEVKMSANDERETLSAGDAVVIKAGEHHEMENVGNEDAQYIVFGVSKGLGGKTVVI